MKVLYKIWGKAGINYDDLYQEARYKAKINNESEWIKTKDGIYKRVKNDTQGKNI